jgi:hypothetical protein
MNTIFIPVYPKPSGANVTQLCVDFNAFDPHDGIRFSVVMKNPEGLVLDKTFTNLAGDDWQDWPPEQTAAADYNYVKNVVLQNLGYTEAVAPYFTTQPENLKVLSGSPAVFTVVASGDAPISYQWYKNQELISGANLEVLTINSVSETNIGTYYVKAQNPVGSTNSNLASLNTFVAPFILSNPSDLSMPSGANAYFSAVFDGDQPITIEWFKDDQSIPDSNSSQYVISGVTQDNVGFYKAKATNIAGSIETSEASLSIIEPTPPTPPEPVPTGIMP